ncbi:MAG: hypothetical protein M0Z99_12980 [Betaproteobacteria bacterium]|nr:hypothetical protein [Betaproteobacteria bacterium]
MSFIYPRTITITRPAVQSGVGTIGYGGQMPSTETPVTSGVSASIQLKKEGRHPETDLPGDITKITLWVVLIPVSAGLSVGVIRDRDILTDDGGLRYQVTAAYWNSLGWNLLCERLEV